MCVNWSQVCRSVLFIEVANHEGFVVSSLPLFVFVCLPLNANKRDVIVYCTFFKVNVHHFRGFVRDLFEFLNIYRMNILFCKMSLAFNTRPLRYVLYQTLPSFFFFFVVTP